jgi:hypothetical protein
MSGKAIWMQVEVSIRRSQMFTIYETVIMDIPLSVLTVCHECNRADTIEKMGEGKCVLGDGKGNRCIMPQSP